MYGKIVASVMLAVLLAFAGCLGTDEGPSSDEGIDGSEGSMETGGQGEGDAVNTTVAPVEVTFEFFLTEEGMLSPEMPTEAALIPVPGSTADAFAGEEIEVLRFRSAPFIGPAMVHGALSGTIWFENTGPTINPGFFDFALWGATTVTKSTSYVENHGVPHAPGDVIQIDFTMPIDHAAPSLVPVGEAFEILVASGGMHEGQTLAVAVGPETPSSVTYTWTVLGEDLPDVSTTTQTHEGHFEGSQFPAPPPGSQTQATYSIEVPEDAQWLEIATTSVSGTGSRVDLDMRLEDGGTEVMRAVESTAEETMLLAGPTLEPYQGKTLQLRVTSYFGADIDYTVEVRTG